MDIPNTAMVCEHCYWPYAHCDYCLNFDFNGDLKGKYTGCGFCNLHFLPSDPDSLCDYYHCFLLDKENK